MKKTLTFLLTFLLIFTAIPALSTNISINDGSRLDWEDILPLVADPEGDSQAPFGIMDLKTIKTTQEGDNLFLFLEFWESGLGVQGQRKGTNFILMNIDPFSSPQTGLTDPYGFLSGTDYGVRIYGNDVSLSDATQGAWINEISLENGSGEYWVELALPISLLNMYGARPETINFATILDVSRGSMNIAPVPEPATLMLLGAGLLGLGGASRKKFNKR